MKKSLAVVLALIMVLCMIPTTAFAVKPGKQSVTIKLAYSDWGYEKTGSKGFTYTYSNPLQGGSGWIYTLGPVEQYVTSQEMSGYTFTGYIVMEHGKRVAKRPGDTWDLGQGNGGMLHVQLQKNNDKPTSSTLQVNTVITGDQTLTSNGTPFSVTVGNGYTPDDYKTGLDTSNYTYTFVKAERKSGTGLFKITASSSNSSTSTDNVYRQFFPASGENIVTVYYTAKIKAAPTPKPDNPPAKPEPVNTSKPFVELTGEEAVKVQCTNDKANHTKKSYGLKFEGYTVGEVQGTKETGYTCDITVQPEKYVEQYNSDIDVEHTLDPASQTGTIKLEWDKEAQKWKLANPSGVPVVFTVKCDSTQPPLDTDTGTIIVKKTVESNDPADKAKEFEFKVTVQGRPGPAPTEQPPIIKAGAVRVENKTATRYDFNNDGVFEFTLKDGDTMTISDLPVGYIYRVEELNADGYTVTVNNETTNSKDVELTKETTLGTLEFKNTKGSTPTPTPTPTPGGGHHHYEPTPVPPIIVNPPKTGDMTIWQSILHFLGIR